jgi:hypothetical protein
LVNKLTKQLNVPEGKTQGLTSSLFYWLTLLFWFVVQEIYKQRKCNQGVRLVFCLLSRKLVHGEPPLVLAALVEGSRNYPVHMHSVLPAHTHTENLKILVKMNKVFIRNAHRC